MKLLFIFSALFSQIALSAPFLPEGLTLPSQIGKRTKGQILTVFSSLESAHRSHEKALYWLKFQKARLMEKKNPKVFCLEMESLSQTEGFPLHDLARIYFYSQCPLTPSPQLLPEEFPPYLRLNLARAFYKRGKKFGDKNLILSSAEYLGKQEEGRELRISYLKHAVFLTKELKDSRQEELKKLLYESAPRLNPRPQFQDYLAIAHDYRSLRAFKKAAWFYRKILNSKTASFEEKNSAFKWLRWIYKNQRRHTKRLQISKQWSLFLSERKTEPAYAAYYKNKLRLAKARWNLDQNDKALEVLDEILSSPNSKAIRSRAHWLKALIKEQDGQWEESLKNLELALNSLKEAKPEDSFFESLLWKKAWILRRSGQKDLAVKAFSDLVRKTKSPYLKVRALYWKGETQWDKNHKVAGIKTFNRLIREDPFGYYGLLAHRRLGKTPDFHVHVMDNLSNLITNIKINQEAVNTAHWLNSLNEREILTRFLKSRKQDLFPGKRKRSRSAWLSLFSLYRAARQHFNVFQLVGSLEPPLKKYFLRNHTELFFPQAYKDEVSTAANRWQMSQALIFALIRQESAFNPRARSTSDAFGLMQLIPSTARAMSRRIKQPYRGIYDLYQPGKNINLGTYYLRYLFQKYDNSFILTVSAYNAGETPVRKWRGEIDTSHPLEFIENITYEETRTYVRLLIRNFIFYNKILNEEKDFFPEWLLQLS